MAPSEFSEKPPIIWKTHLESPGVSSNPAKASLDLIDDDQTSELTNVTKNSIENDN